MGATNWTHCPVCVDTELIKRYPAWASWPEEAQQLILEFWKSSENETWREDYEISGVANGKLIISYHGHCEECGMEITLHQEHQFYPALDAETTKNLEEALKVQERQKAVLYGG